MAPSFRPERFASSYLSAISRPSSQKQRTCRRCHHVSNRCREMQGSHFSPLERPEEFASLIWNAMWVGGDEIGDEIDRILYPRRSCNMYCTHTVLHHLQTLEIFVLHVVVPIIRLFRVKVNLLRQGRKKNKSPSYRTQSSNLEIVFDSFRSPCPSQP